MWKEYNIPFCSRTNTYLPNIDNEYCCNTCITSIHDVLKGSARSRSLPTGANFRLGKKLTCWVFSKCSFMSEQEEISNASALHSSLKSAGTRINTAHVLPSTFHRLLTTLQLTRWHIFVHKCWRAAVLHHFCLHFTQKEILEKFQIFVKISSRWGNMKNGPVPAGTALL